MKVYDYSLEEAKAYAEEASRSLVFRTFNNGDSRDERRDSTEEEAGMLRLAIYAALLAIRGNHESVGETGNEWGAKAAAEYFILAWQDSGGLDAPHINTYDSVYIPINNYLNAHRQGGKDDRS
jgi:hypothetical protein